MATATNGTIDLEQRFGVNWTRNAQLKNLVNPATGVTYTYQSAKDRFPRMVGYAEYKGFQPAEVLNMYEFEVAWNEAFFITWGYFTELSPAYGDLRSRGSILAPDGFYLTTFGCLYGYGRYLAKGSNIYWVLAGLPNAGSTAGTGLGVDHANWMTARALERMPLRSCSWGLDTGNAYMQGTVIAGFYLDGGCAGKSYDPSFKSYGLGMWDAGEASTVYNCYASGFNDGGFCSPKGTPANFFACSAFSNGKGGLIIQGNNGLSTTTITGFSGDDNGGGLITVEALSGQTSGGTIVINGLKSENGKRTPYRQQKAVVAKGALNMVINGASVDSQNEMVDVAFDIDFQTFPGQVEIHGARLNGYTNAMRLTAKGVTTLIPSPGNIVPFSLDVDERGVIRNTRTTATPTPPPDPNPVPPPTGSFLPRTAWKMTAVKSAPPDSFGAHTPDLMIDGLPTSFYHNGEGQTAAGTQWVTAELKATKFMIGLELTLPPQAYSNDWPRKLKVQTSTNGTSWSDRGTFAGGPTTHITFPEVSASWVRFAPAETSNGAWWAVGNLEIIGR